MRLSDVAAGACFVCGKPRAAEDLEDVTYPAPSPPGVMPIPATIRFCRDDSACREGAEKMVAMRSGGRTKLS